MHIHTLATLLFLRLLSMFLLAAASLVDNGVPPPVPPPVPWPHPPIQLKLYRYQKDQCYGSINAINRMDQSHPPIVITENRCYPSLGRGEGFRSFLVGFMPLIGANGTALPGYERFVDFGECTVTVSTREDCAEGDPSSIEAGGYWRSKKFLDHDRNMTVKIHAMETAIGCQRRWKHKLVGEVARGIRVHCTGRKKNVDITQMDWREREAAEASWNGMKGV